MKLVKRLLALASNHLGAMLLACVGIVGGALLNLVTPALMREFTSRLEEDSQLTNNALLIIAGGLLAAYIVRALCRSITLGVSHIAAWQFVAELTLKVYDKFEQLSMRYFQDKQTGDLMSRMINDTRQLEVLIAHSIPDLAGNLIMIVGVCVMMFVINPSLALITMIPVPFLIFFGWLYSKKVAPMFRVNSRVLGELNGVVQDNLTGMKEIKAFGCEESEHLKMRENCRYYAKVNIRANLANAVFTPGIELATSAGTIIVVLFGGLLAMRGDMAVSDIVGFVMYLSLFYTPLAVLARMVEDLQVAAASSQRIFDVLDSECEITEKPNAIELSDCKGEVSFDKVSFHYTPDEPVLDEVSFVAKPGEMIALVGPTGVGKTTVVSLLERFWDPISGAIKIDGVDIRDVKISSLRSQISMVLQDVFLFNGTIAENIAYGSSGVAGDSFTQLVTDSGALDVDGVSEPIINTIRKNPATDVIISSSVKSLDMEKIREAARIAHADEFIEAMPNGYETLIGERGVRLSGGQKQRIAIARAVLRGTPILVLDEATSAVDNETEAEIQAAIESLAGSRTIIVIAHRLSTVKRADRIIVLEEGRVVEEGRHDDLVAAGGLYAKLCLGRYGEA